MLAGKIPNKTDAERLRSLKSSDSTEYYEFQNTLLKAAELTLDDISVGTIEKANIAVKVVEGALEYALDLATNLGAYQKRMDVAADNVVTMGENVRASESTIRDSDMARETTNYTKYNILSQSAQSMLAQANQKSSDVLSLENFLAFKDLREFIAELEKRNLLKRIKVPVDAELEITEITDRVSKFRDSRNVALLFENVRGYDIPVLTNMFGSYERMALALGVNKLDDAADDIRELLKLPYISLKNRMNIVSIISTGSKVINFPKYVKNAPCQEIVEENPNLDKIPILKCWPQDGGNFITLPLVFTKNPKTGKRNVGMYRLQKFDSTTTGMHWHIHKNGAENFRDAQVEGQDKIEVAVAIGTDPVVTYAATAPLPRDVDEMVFAGFLRHKSVELTKCKTVDLEVPATAEFILEGYVNTNEFRREGPFGDHTGYYSLADDLVSLTGKILFIPQRLSVSRLWKIVIWRRLPKEFFYRFFNKLFLKLLI